MPYEYILQDRHTYIEMPGRISFCAYLWCWLSCRCSFYAASASTYYLLYCRLTSS